jgi:hypothetical protein
VLNTIISILIVVIPVGIFLAIQFASQREQNKNHWPQPKKTEAEPDKESPKGGPVRKAKAKTFSGPSCGRHFAHAMLTVVGARGSCKHCAALPRKEPAQITDLLAEAERIVNEKQD